MNEQRFGSTLALQQRASLQRDSINYFPSGASQPCRLAFFTDLGRIYFHLPGGIQYGQHWLNVKFANSLVRVPFRILTRDEEKFVGKNLKDIHQQVADDFKPKCCGAAPDCHRFLALRASPNRPYSPHEASPGMKEMRMSFRPLPLCLILSFSIATAAQAVPDGALDPTFAGDGWDFWNPSFSTGVKVDDLAVRPDGQLAITGRVFAVADREALSCLRSANGGSGTCVNLPFDLGGGNNNDGNGVAVQSDNRTVLVGDAQGTVADPAWVATATRMTSANSLDGTFDGGAGAFQLGSTYDVGAEAVTVANDRIYLAGSIGVNMGGGEVGSDFFVAVRKADGTSETAWSGDGINTIGFNLGANGDDYAQAIAVDAFGRTVVAGTATDGVDIYFAVARFTVDGAYDGNWSGDARQTVLVDLGGVGNLTFGGMAVDRFSRVLLAGVVPTATGSRLVVVRLTAAGALDSTFGGGDGIADFAYGATDDIATVVDIVALTPPSDRIAILGDYDPAGADPIDSFLLVLTPNGTLDTTFNGSGKRSLAPPSGDPWNHAQALAVQSGRLVVLGGYHPTTTSVNLAWLARVQMSLIFGDDFDTGNLGLWSSVAP